MDDNDLCEMGQHDMQPYQDLDGNEGTGCTNCGITPEEL